MSVGLHFFNRLLTDRDCPDFQSQYGINRAYFIEDEARIFSFVGKFLMKYAKLPALETVERKLKIEFPESPDEPLEFWADQLATRHTAKLIRDGIESILGQMQEGKATKASELVQDLSRKLVSVDPNLKISTLADLAFAALEAHDKRQQTPLGREVDLPFGFPYLDDVSDGLQPADSIVIVGPTGIGKSYVLCRMAKALHDSGGVPLFVSMEMPGIQVGRRMLALRNKISDTLIRKGQLQTFVGRERVARDIGSIDDAPPFFVADGQLVLTIDHLSGLISSLRPDAVYVDGAYLLRVSSSFRSKQEGMEYAAEQLKIIAGRAHLPIVSTYQLNEQGKVRGSRSIEHLASILLYIMEGSTDVNNDDWGFDEGRIIEIRKGRQGESGRFSITYNMLNTSIEQNEVTHTHTPRISHTRRRRNRDEE